MKLLFVIIVTLFPLASHAIVLKRPDGPRDDPEPIIPDQPLDICALPDGSAGKTSLLEDCTFLDLLQDSQPSQIINYRGSSVIICCPMPQEPFTGILFPDDLKELEEFYDSYDDYTTGPGDYPDYPGEPTQSSQSCDEIAPGTSCRDLGACSSTDISGERPPLLCGWNSNLKRHKFCCKGGRQRSPQPSRINRRYPCEDYHSKCQEWAREHPESCTNNTHLSFDFMTTACMKSCDFCQNKECTDEFSKCPQWSRNGFCSSSPDFMARYCRESCGSCGFKSPRNREKQNAGGRSYTDERDPNFFCGEGKSKEEINKNVPAIRRSKRQAKENFKLFYYATELENSKRGIRCGSVIINDRFVIFAAHCYSNFGTPTSQEETLTIILRDGTKYADQVEVRRVFVHPEYRFPSLYYDIAIAELGRRIEYDYDKFGDSPACLGQGLNLEGFQASSEGYGFTEKGVTSDILLTTNVTIIGNADCAQYLSDNTTDKPVLKARVKLALADGLNDQLLCSTGHKVEDVYSGPCEGDSGGPLYVNYRQGTKRKQTVEGIVSGGIACGENVPSWYTKVSSFRDWILCIIEQIKITNNKSLAEERCNSARRSFSPKNIVK